MPEWLELIIDFIASMGFFAILFIFIIIGIFVGLGFLMQKITLMVKKRKVKLYGRYEINIFKIPSVAKDIESGDSLRIPFIVSLGKIVKRYRTDKIISYGKTEVKFINKKGLEQVVKGEYIKIKDYLEDVEFQQEKLDLEYKGKQAYKKVNKKAAKKYLKELERKYY